MSKFSPHLYATVLFTIVLSISSLAQTGSIAGIVLDASTKESLIGAAVFIEGQEASGTATDLDGKYNLSNITPGTYNLIVRYVSFQTKNINNVVVEDGKITNLDVALDQSTKELETVVVTTTFRQETINSVLAIQKNNVSISDGISKDIIQRSPDKNTGEVLKRMSGTTLQDGKFAIIRGLSDRYNTALINGNILPSSEADRKSFAFDLFPSALLDNLFIYKTAQPDLPGDFAGGIILLNTRDIPDENFISISIGSGYNTQSAFKPYSDYTGGKKDWLGIDDGTRGIPNGFPSVKGFQTATTDEQIQYSNLMLNNWGSIKHASSPPDMNYQLSGGWVKQAGKNQFGLIGALTYNNSRAFVDITRKEFQDEVTEFYEYNDSVYRNDILWGAILNASYKIGDNNKISLKNSYSVNSSDVTTIRAGRNFSMGEYLSNEFFNFVSNQLFNSTLSGDHYLPKSKIKLKWSLGTNHFVRDQPDLRTSYYFKNFTPAFPADTIFQTVFLTIPTTNGNFKFYSYMEDKSILGTIDLSYPFMLSHVPQTFKIGALIYNKDRTFNARQMGYAVSQQFYNNPNYYDYLILPRNELFIPENISSSLFFLEEITRPSDSYTAQETNRAAYAMFDNKVGNNLRIVWGVRAEFFNQHLNSYFFNGGVDSIPIEVDTKKQDSLGLPYDLMPSINMIYSVNKKFNIRIAGSKTVVRPEIRELAPFSFYDFETTSNVTGNPNLKSTDIYNGDLRFEYYPGSGQVLSASLFYKYFINPIESSVFLGDVIKERHPINEDHARNYGAEIEVRKNFAFINPENKFLKNLIFSTNLAYINSLIQVTDSAYYGVAERPLQGQSPFVINTALTWFNPETGFAVTILFNEIGRRIADLGYKNYPDIYENPKPQLDAQISIPFLKNNGIVRVNFADILSEDAIFYQDVDKSGKYEPDADNVITQINTGVRISASVTYRF